MPHVVIEYSANVEQFAEAVPIAHDVMIQSGLFTTEDIKTRSYAAENFLVGKKGNQGRFVHVTISILEGRTTKQKQALSEAMRDALCVPLKEVDQLSIDIHELIKDTYRKHVR